MNESYARREAPAAGRRPADLAAAEVDNTTGFLATAFCPTEVHLIESFIPGTEPTQYCPVHTQGILNPFGIGGGMFPQGASGAQPLQQTDTVGAAPRPE